jgi:dihydropteroate synthase
MNDHDVFSPTVWHCGRFHFDWQKSPMPIVMGILNITPDSFSDGGKFFDHSLAITHAYQMIEEGATMIDIGGESTKPGAIPVSLQEELDRVLPVIEKLQNCGVALSIDTYKSETMRYALDLGIDVINDVSGFEDAKSIAVAASSKDVGLCVMHMQNTPQTMQVEPHYEDVVEQVSEFLNLSLNRLKAQGIDAKRIAIDPGFGFGKTVEHNLLLLHHLEKIKRGTTPLLVGLSRKKTLAKILGSDTRDKTFASVAAALLAVERGANIVRVHDVGPTVDALKIWTAMRLEHPL